MRFAGKAFSGGVAFAAIVALLWLGFRPYLGCVSVLEFAPGAYCVFSDEGRRGPPKRKERLFSVDLAELTPATVAPTLTAYGEVRSGRSWEIRTEAGGRIVEVADGFRDGAATAAGQVLLKIDPADPASAQADARAAVTEAEAERAEALQALELSRSEKTAAAAQRALRKRLLDRQKALKARGVVAQTTLDEAELALADAERAVIARDQAVAAAERRASQSEAQLERARLALADARRTLGETEITAPFAGVLSVDAEVEAGAGLTVGRVVQVNERLGALIDPTAMEVWFRVSDAEFARLLDAEGRLARLPATARLALGERSVSAPARLTRVSATAAPAEGGRRVYARLSVGPDTVLRPGDFVSVEIEEPALTRVARIPAAALDDAERIYVVGAEDRLEAVPVTILRRQGDDVLVRAAEGRTPWGRRYVSAVAPRLAAGVKVAPASLERDETAPDAGAARTAAARTAERVALAPARRRALIAFVEGNESLSEARRARILSALKEPEAPAALVQRLERRMGAASGSGSGGAAD